MATPSPFPTSPESVDKGILLATLPNLSTPHFLGSVVTAAATQTRHRLVVVLFSRHFNTSHRPRGGIGTLLGDTQTLSHTDTWDSVQRILTLVYVHATKAAQALNKVLMDVDVLLKGLDEDLDPHLGDGIDIVFRVSGDSIAVPLPESLSDTRQCFLPAGDRNPDFREFSTTGSPAASGLPAKPHFYPVVALGGTFDHLHAGHKILLSMGAWITEEKLIVGVTDDALLQNKANKHVIEKLPQRIERVRSFLTFFKPGLVYDIVPLCDVAGPTGWDPNVQGLVVSKETLSGAAAIAELRKEKGFPPLEVFVIDVISSTSPNLTHHDAGWLKKTKLSSTWIREWIVNHSKQEEEEDE